MTETKFTKLPGGNYKVTRNGKKVGVIRKMKGYWLAEGGTGIVTHVIAQRRLLSSAKKLFP